MTAYASRRHDGCRRWLSLRSSRRACAGQNKTAASFWPAEPSCRSRAKAFLRDAFVLERERKPSFRKADRAFAADNRSDGLHFAWAGNGLSRPLRAEQKSVANST